MKKQYSGDMAIRNMRGHMGESNKILEPLSKNNNFPLPVLEKFETLQGSLNWFNVIFFLYINAKNKIVINNPLIILLLGF